MHLLRTCTMIKTLFLIFSLKRRDLTLRYVTLLVDCNRTSQRAFLIVFYFLPCICMHATRVPKTIIHKLSQCLDVLPTPRRHNKSRFHSHRHSRRHRDNSSRNRNVLACLRHNRILIHNCCNKTMEHSYHGDSNHYFPRQYTALTCSNNINFNNFNSKNYRFKSKIWKCQKCRYIHLKNAVVARILQAKATPSVPTRRRRRFLVVLLLQSFTRLRHQQLSKPYGNLLHRQQRRVQPCSSHTKPLKNHKLIL
jgi:hypothetical protein